MNENRVKLLIDKIEEQMVITASDQELIDALIEELELE